MSFSLGTISPLRVQAWSGFDYPERAQVLPLLGNGTAAANAVVQQAALTYREATISGTLTSSADRDALRTMYEGKSVVAFVDDTSTTYQVEVFDLQIARIFIGVWTYQARLVQVIPPSWVADFTASPTSGAHALAVAFTEGGPASVGVPLAVVWTFDDGASSASRNPSHTYASAGTYHPVMSAVFPDGTTATATHTITVT